MTDFDLQAIVDALPYLILSGLRFTLLLTFTSTVGGLLLGTLLAIARLYGGRLLAWPATVYVNLFRSLPLVLVIFLIYFILPYALQAVTGAERPIVLGAMGSAFITFILFEAAYFSEIIRAGVGSVGHGQYAAGSALGLRHGQVLRKVILPQAFRRILPPLGNNAIAIVKDSSLASAIGLADLAYAARTVSGAYATYWEPYLTISLVYWVITFLLAQLVNRLEKRFGKSDSH